MGIDDVSEFVKKQASKYLCKEKFEHFAKLSSYEEILTYLAENLSEDDLRDMQFGLADYLSARPHPKAAIWDASK